MHVHRLVHKTFAVIAVLAICALPAQTATPRILLVGDSWAWALGNFGSFASVFAEDGASDFSVVGDVNGTLQTAIPGSFASQWADSGTGYLARIDDQLTANPSIDIVHISLGGNDFIWNIDGSKSPAELDAFYQGIADDIEVVVDHILALNPAIHVGLSTYDYMTKSNETTTAIQTNVLQVDFSHYLKAVADTRPRCAFVNNLGLMQHHFGIAGVYEPGELPAPGGPPSYTPFAGGNLDYEGVEIRIPIYDPIHLSNAGYQVMARNCLEQVYYDWLGFTTPGIVGITAVDPSTTDVPYPRYRVEFSEAVTGVDITDFSIATTGEIVHASISAIYGSGSVYYVYVDRGMGSGAITLTLHDDDSIVSASYQRQLNGEGSGSTTAPTYTISTSESLPVSVWPVMAALGLCGTWMLAQQRFSRRDKRLLN